MTRFVTPAGGGDHHDHRHLRLKQEHLHARIVAASIGGAVTSASRFVTCESCSVVARIASSTSRRIVDSSRRWRGTGRPPST